jgi:hypothetical protein
LEAPFLYVDLKYRAFARYVGNRKPERCELANQR